MPDIKALQMMLPAIEKMALSPKSAQPAQQLFQLRKLVEPGAEAAQSPWQRMMQMIPKGEASPGFRMRPERIESGFPKGMSFSLSEAGRAPWKGSVTSTKTNPFELYVEGLHTSGSRRAGIGNPEQGLASYTMDITSPAQRELPLRGMKLGAKDKAERVATGRPAEERYPVSRFQGGLGDLPTPSMRGKQQGVDRMLDLARQSGFKRLAFSAEPGERPRLYEKLTGYKAKMEGDEDITSLLGRMTGRAPTGRPMTPQQSLTQPGATLSPQMLEQMIGLSIEEAVEFGLARRLGQSNLYQLTDQGRQSAAQWAGGAQ